MKSFDFYDTLFTRLVGTPTGIFQIVEERLGLVGFAERRRLAEVATKTRVRDREVSIAEIYAELDISSDKKQEAMELELSLEQQLVSPVNANIARVRSDDLVVSDMYLPASVLQSVLDSHLPEGVVPQLAVSSQYGYRKSDGALWKHLMEEKVRISLHIGDNSHSDVRVPTQYGIHCEHFTEATLNRYERRYLAAAGLNGNIVAGCSRAARLSSQTASAPVGSSSHAIGSTFSSVIAPLLVAFVSEVLDDCVDRGIRRILFLARDGQVLYRIAEQLVVARRLDVEVRYVYASRHALHLPGYREPQEAARWLLEGTRRLTLQDIANRAGIEVEVMLEGGRAIGIDNSTANIPTSVRPRLLAAICTDTVNERIRAASDRAWPMAYRYFRQSGLVPGSKVALVDVGWTGRMQASLRSILDRGNERAIEVRGYYLCLSSKLRTSPLDELKGFLHDPESGIRCIFDPYRAVIEASLMADHGTTVGYCDEQGQVTPVIGESPPTDVVDLVRAQQNVVLRFTELLLKVEAAIGRRISLPRDVVIQNLRTMLQFPTFTDAIAYERHGLSIQQVEGEAERLVTSRLGVRDVLKWQMSLWPEGSLAASGKRVLLPLLAAARRANGLRRHGFGG